MGMNAALKMRQIVEDVEMVIAIELLCAAQGLDYRKPLKPGEQIGQVLDAIRKIVPRLEADRPPSTDINQLVQAIHEGVFDAFAD
jgi:histidine ammonia-lyase